MEGSPVARSYASALFDLAGREDAHEDYAGHLDRLVRLVRDEPRLRAFFESPVVEREEKKRILREALADGVPERFLRFLFVVVDKRRFRLLPAVAREYRARLDRHFGRVRAEVTLAREPDERFEEEIAKDLSRRLGRTVVPHFRVDERVLGGIRVRYEDRVIDATLQRRLMGLRGSLLSAEVGGRP